MDSPALTLGYWIWIPHIKLLDISTKVFGCPRRPLLSVNQGILITIRVVPTPSLHVHYPYLKGYMGRKFGNKE